MNTKDLRKKNTGELTEMLNEKNEALTKFAFGMSGAKTKDTKAARNLRREVARIKTLMNESKQA
jgi:ribosomal protein L29